MSRATVELDFFGLEKAKAASNLRSAASEPRSSIRGIQHAISRINPDLLRSVIASGSGGADPRHRQPPAPFWNSAAMPVPPRSAPPAANSFSILNTASRSACESAPKTAPLTIFYNGTVIVVNVAQHTAENIIKMAGKVTAGSDPNGFGGFGLLQRLNGDLPLARKKSLLRFLEKRRERLTQRAPYVMGTEFGSGKKRECFFGVMTAPNF